MEQQRFWKLPWDYAQGIVVIFSFTIVGFFIEFYSGGTKLFIPRFPVNLYLLVINIFLSIFIYNTSFLKHIKQWLSSKKFAIIALCFLAILIGISGYLPESGQHHHPTLKKWGLFHITEGIPFTLLVILISQSLLIITIPKITTFHRKNLPFILNHLGVYIILMSGSLGSGDMIRAKMYLNINKAQWQGHLSDYPSRNIDLPFALKLNKFEIKEFSPELVFLSSNNKIISKCGTITGKEKEVCSFKGKSIKLESYTNDGFKVKDKYVSVKHIGTAPIAKISVQDEKSEQSFTNGYITPGSMIQRPQFLKIDDNIKLALLTPKIKHYESYGNFYTPEEKTGPFKISVNKPFELDGWKLYQYGYDENKGKWSDLSIIEAIKDPWLPLTYAGFFMLILGTILFAFLSTSKKNR